MKLPRHIFSLLFLSFFCVPLLSYASTGTGIFVTDVDYTADAHTAQFTVTYTYETEGAYNPMGFRMVAHLITAPDDDGYYYSPIFGPEIETPGPGIRTAVVTLLGLELNSVYTYYVYAMGIEMDSYWGEDIFTTGASDGVFISGDTVPPLGTPTDDSYYLLAPLPLVGIQMDAEGNQFLNIGGTDGPGENFDFGDYVNGLLTFAIGIAGALAVVMIVVGGIQYMSTDNFGEKAQGKEHIKNSLGGLILLIGAYMILNTINPDLVNLNFQVSGVSVAATEIIDGGYSVDFNTDGTGTITGPGITNTNIAVTCNKSIPTYDAMLASEATAYGLECNVLKATMYTESCGNPEASSGEAVGLMQFTPPAWTDYGTGTYEPNAKDPAQSIKASANYQKALKTTGCNLHASNTACTTTERKYVMAAYNAGPGSNAVAACGLTKWECTPYEETLKYVVLIEAHKQLIEKNGWGC